MDRKRFLQKSAILGAGLSLNSFKLDNSSLNLTNLVIYKNYLRGCEYYWDNLSKIEINNDLNPSLKRELENKYDKFAIAVYLQGLKVGYIAAFENVVIAKMIDQGVKITPKIFIDEAFINEKNYYISDYLIVQLHTELLTTSENILNNRLDNQCTDDAKDSYRRNI